MASRRTSAPSRNATSASSREAHGAVRSVDAAALQSDMARRFNLPGAAVKRVKYLVTNNTYKNGERATTSQCPSCAQHVSTSSATCPNCGIFFRSIREYVPSLSEIRGLVKSTSVEVTPLTKEQWVCIEVRLMDRKDCVCPICMENFKDGNEVLLSCSHMFHRWFIINFNTHNIVLIS